MAHNENTEDNIIFINHIAPLRERLIGMEKTIEYHEKELQQVNSALTDLKVSVLENVNLARKTYWLLIGGGVATGAFWAFFKFIFPIIGVPVE